MPRIPAMNCSKCGTLYPVDRSACPACGIPCERPTLCGFCGDTFYARLPGPLACPNGDCKFLADFVPCSECAALYWAGSPSCPHCHMLNCDIFFACRECGFYFPRVLFSCPHCHSRRIQKAHPTPSPPLAPEAPPVRECGKCGFTIPSHSDRCPTCGLIVWQASSVGYVYVLTHPQMPGLVKIGKTQRHPDERLAELSQHTGVPGAFILAYHREVNDCDDVERVVHLRLSAHRVEGKEFFRISPEAAIEAVVEASRSGP
jgi:RNA polymerase subunit RPABC4/transcription elongation factor Spt4